MQIGSGGGLLVMRELYDTLGLSNLVSVALRDTHHGKNTIHRFDGIFRHSIFGGPPQTNLTKKPAIMCTGQRTPVPTVVNAFPKISL